jgi:heavy metal translocating P-type ATPase
MTDVLIGLAVVAAWASGDLATAALLPIVMIVAHVLEERSLLGSRDAIRALGRLTQTTARRVGTDGSEELVPTALLRTGDRVRLRAGDRAPCDGTVLQGQASMDVSSLTGESVPVDVAQGDTVLAGSIDTNGALEVLATSTGAETTLGKIIALLRDAERAKPPVTRLLEKYASEYLALVLMIAAATWLTSGDMEATLAVLVASCPCALVLAAPATSIAAIAVAARHGILIKSTAFLENLADVTSVVFDKTGTLTNGTLRLVQVAPVAGIEPQVVLAVAGALGVASSHPVSRATAAAAGSVEPAATVQEMGGFGMVGRLGADQVGFGRPDLFGQLGVAAPPVPEHGGPIAGVSRGGTFLGWLLFADEPRPEAQAALAELRQIGLTRQTLLTGDRAAVARQVAATLQIGTVIAEALPADKMRHVLAEVNAGQKPLVVGDGINDSLALKAGAVGIAMGAQGTDVALASADLVLMTSDLRRLSTALRLSRRCRRTIHWNVALALGWTVFLVGLAAAGLLGAAGAIVAALLHNLSTFLGMANAGRVLLFDESGQEG